VVLIRQISFDSSCTEFRFYCLAESVFLDSSDAFDVSDEWRIRFDE
jgi:hypothetical protein